MTALLDRTAALPEFETPALREMSARWAALQAREIELRNDYTRASAIAAATNADEDRAAVAKLVAEAQKISSECGAVGNTLRSLRDERRAAVALEVSSGKHYRETLRAALVAKAEGLTAVASLVHIHTELIRHGAHIAPIPPPAYFAEVEQLTAFAKAVVGARQVSAADLPDWLRARVTAS